MNSVEPIRDQIKIEMMKQVLLKQSYRNYLLFVVGINTGLRISDLLTLKVSDVRFKTHIIIKEKKTDKMKKFKINPNLASEVEKYTDDMEGNEFLFPSREGMGTRALGRIMVYNFLNEAARQLKMDYKIGTHTMRKTFGYHFYQKYKDVALLQELFNHSSPSVTLRYIGINQDIMDNAVDSFSL